MKQEDILKEKTGCDSGFRVPEGYFETFRVELMESLPEYPKAPKAVPLTVWQRLKPYVYLAAMFCGIWCMMKIFHDLSSRQQGGLDNMPESVVLAMSDTETVDFISASETGDADISLEYEVSRMYDNMDDLEADLGIMLKPEYREIEG